MSNTLRLKLWVYKDETKKTKQKKDQNKETQKTQPNKKTHQHLKPKIISS